MKEKNRLKVMIYGEEYTIKGSADPTHIKKVANFVDQKMEQISHTNSFLSIKQIAVLVALNLADELLCLREDYDELIKILDGMHKRKKS
ncbi:MAG TPA: cell division protein ZapA [Clostridia bacterium]|nr:cell division protein ZapA [Clostridia bacterium]